jgi:hypothetical protein
MSQTPLPTENLEQRDPLDGLLSDFFKAQLKKPWPAAPATPPTSTPSAAAAPTAAPAQTPRNQPAARRDSSANARYTLVASVALLLGTCWAMSNGFQPAKLNVPSGSNVVDPSGASDPDALKELRKSNAIRGEKGITPPVIEFP